MAQIASVLDVPQFGEALAGRAYPDRPAAFGLALKDGRLALVQVDKGEGPYLDLPGGGVEAGESPAEAMVRELGEETGLVVSAEGEAFAAASQRFFRTPEETVNNRCLFFRAQIEGERPELKIEADHRLVWREPAEALARLRHPAHAWAVAAWLRTAGGR